MTEQKETVPRKRHLDKTCSHCGISGAEAQSNNREVTLGLSCDEFNLLIEMAGYAAGALAADKSVSEERSSAAARMAEDLKWRATYHNFFYKAL